MDGQIIDVVQEYTYGTRISWSGNFSVSREHLKEKALHALFSFLSSNSLRSCLNGSDMLLHHHSAHLLLDPFEPPKVLFHPTFRGRREEKWWSFRGRFGDHFRVGDHFGVGIISGAVQCPRSTTKQSIKITTQGTHSHVSVFAFYFLKFFFGQVITLK